LSRAVATVRQPAAAVSLLRILRPGAGLPALCVLFSLLAMGRSFGQAQNVVSIEISGNHNVRTETILQAVTQTKKGEPLSETKLQADASAIAQMGYFEPGVVSWDRQARVNAYAQPVEGGVKVVFEVVEYPPIEDIAFRGNTLVSSADMKAKMTLAPGSVFNEKILANDMVRIKNEYRSRGYIVDITDVKRLAGILHAEEIILSIQLVEGWVEKIEVTGLVRTKMKAVVRNIVDTVAGQKYDDRKVLADRRRLLNLQLFEGQQGVNVRPMPGSKPGAVVVAFDLQEARTGLLNLGVGYNNRDRAVGFLEATENNLFGLAHRANVRWEFGGVTSYELGYYTPYIDSKRTSLTTNIYDKWLNRFVSPEFSAITQLASTRNERRQGVDVTLTRPLNKEETSSVWVTARAEDVSGRFTEPGTSILLKSFYTEGKVNSITVKGLMDTSDYIADPTGGWRNSLSLEKAGGFFGGERSYTKYSLDLRHYTPLGNNVLAARAIVGTSIGDLPLFDAFIAGGSETLRGYPEDRFWGRKTVLANIEYRVPISGKQERKVQAVGFLDVGDAYGGVWRTSDNSVIYPAEHQRFSPRWGYGFGLRFNVGVGWMRLDLGFSQEGDQAYFSFGHMF